MRSKIDGVARAAGGQQNLLGRLQPGRRRSAGESAYETSTSLHHPVWEL